MVFRPFSMTNNFAVNRTKRKRQKEWEMRNSRGLLIAHRPRYARSSIFCGSLTFSSHSFLHFSLWEKKKIERSLISVISIVIYYISSYYDFIDYLLIISFVGLCLQIPFDFFSHYYSLQCRVRINMDKKRKKQKKNDKEDGQLTLNYWIYAMIFDRAY